MVTRTEAPKPVTAIAAALAMALALAVVFGAGACARFAGGGGDGSTGDATTGADATMTVEATAPAEATTTMEATTSVDATAAADAADDEEASPPEPVKPVNAAGLWKLIHQERYERWKAAPGFASFRPGTGPHDARIRIWVNDVAAEALAARPRPRVFPPGSIIAKNGYNRSLRLRLIAVMRKQADGKWFFAEWRPTGRLLAAGVNAPACANCHRAGQDYVRAFKLRP